MSLVSEGTKVIKCDTFKKENPRPITIILYLTFLYKLVSLLSPVNSPRVLDSILILIFEW